MKIGSQFWQVDIVAEADNQPYYYYPRFIYSSAHLDYYKKQLGKWTFPTEEEAEKKVQELNKSIDNKKIL